MSEGLSKAGRLTVSWVGVVDYVDVGLVLDVLNRWKVLCVVQGCIRIFVSLLITRCWIHIGCSSRFIFASVGILRTMRRNPIVND